DEPEVRDLLVMLLEQAGFRAFAVADGPAAIDLVARGPVAFDLALVDYNLPKAMNGVEVATAIRSMLQREIDVIILTGDISTETLQAIAKYNCIRFNKPIKPSELIDTIQQMLLAAPKVPHRQKPVVKASPVTPTQSAPRVVIVDDDPAIGRALSELLVANGREVETYLSAEEFLERGKTDVEGCILVDAYLPGLSGLDLLSRLKALDSPLSAIMITGRSDVGVAVTAMKAGAIDFIEKPIAPDALLACIDAALTRSHTSSGSQASRAAAADMIRTLTPRQVQIMDLVLAGHPSKNIAADLNLSQRTVENHRATIMKKMGAKSLPGLARAVFPGGG
ncbi:MAG: response regulator, partial [Alphaproteobacteria bacterium]